MRARNWKEHSRSSAVVKSFPSRKAERGDGQAAFVVLIQSHKATRGSHALLWSPTLSSVCKDKEKWHVRMIVIRSKAKEKKYARERDKKLSISLSPALTYHLTSNPSISPSSGLCYRMCMQTLGLLPLSVRSNQHHFRRACRFTRIFVLPTQKSLSWPYLDD